MKINNESYFTIFMMMLSLAAAVYAIANWDFKSALVPAICGSATFVLCFFQLL
jgi:hypothetical protein